MEENEVTSVEIPATFTYENKTYKITKIGNKAFYKCCNITSVNIPDTVTEIEDGVNNEESEEFYGAFMYSGITSIQLPNSITKIGDYAFYYCYGLTSITIPDSVTKIGDSAFSGCRNENLSITIPDSVTTIGESAFDYVENIYYNTDCEELRNQEGYPHWGAYHYNNQIGDDHMK